MATLTDSYMGHVGDVLDMLAQDRTLDPISLAFVASSATPLLPDNVDTDATPNIQKVNVALQRVVQKMFLLEHELSRHRRECPSSVNNGHYYFSQPGGLSPADLALVAPPILTPPVDPLSPPMSASTRWSSGTTAWEFVDQDAPFPAPSSCPSQEKRPSLSSLQTLSAVARSSIDSNINSNTHSRGHIHNYININDSVPVMQTHPFVVSPASPSSSSSLPDQTLSSELFTSSTVSAAATTATSTAVSRTALTTGYSSSTETAATLGNFLLPDVEPSIPSSPAESFCSAHSSLPFDDADIVSTEALSLPIPIHQNGTVPSLVASEGPCATCIYQCALVATAVVKGDLGVRIHCKREACNQSALTVSINQMVAKLSNFTEEVIQVAAQGVEGKLGVQAKIEDERGIWKEFVSHLNTMTVGHSEQVRDIASVCTAVAHGDLSQKITVSVKGETLVLKNTINTMVDQLRSFSSEVTRVAHEVGTEGKLGGQAHVKGVDGTWKELTDNVNTMAANLTAQVRDIASVSKAVAKGDLSKKISVEVKGEMMDLKHTINTMVDQLQEFATEVSRVSLEVGTEGKLGGQAHVKDVSGTWKELTDNVNLMASNLTGQVRDIATVCKAVACGDLTKKVSVPVQGEILELKETMNTMVDQLRTFAAEVTRVAREVGTEGKLGGQAEVEGVDGTWKELTDNVNTMAENLTAQVRDIANVSKAVARGDLSKKISVEVKGEILDLKNTINIM
ncbi:hypothetical protein EDD11_008569, partial [Mortierella claussenii]